MVTLPPRRRSVGGVALRVGAAAALLVGALGLAGTVTTGSQSTLDRSRIVPGASDQQNDRLVRVAQRQVMMPVPAQNNRHAVLMPL